MSGRFKVFSEKEKAFISGLCCALASARPVHGATIRMILSEAGIKSLDEIRHFVPETDIGWIEHAFEKGR